MKLNIEDLIAAQRLREQINAQDLKTIEWFWNGEKINFKTDAIKDWEYTGLSNTDFIHWQDLESIIEETK